jgi:hypothetical protein
MDYSHVYGDGKKLTSTENRKSEVDEETIDKVLEALGFAKMTSEQMKQYFYERPSVRLQVNYAMIRFVERTLNGKVGFKILQDDPRAFSNAVLIPEHNQIDIHIRMPVFDAWNNLVDYIDIDVYFPIREIEKVLQLIRENQ